MRSLVLLLAAAFCLPACALAEDSYHLVGYVTSIQPSGSFDVDGRHIRVTPASKWEIHVDGGKKAVPAPASLYLGEKLDVTGDFNHTSDTLTVDEIFVVPPGEVSVKGIAIIDLAPAATAGQAATARVVRADGYMLHITDKTKLNLTAPLAGMADIATNQWIDYEGVQQLDGTVLVNYAGICRNSVGHSETKLIKKTNYDPDKVTDADHQDDISKFFFGKDIKRIPPVAEADMLARLQRIGNSLIPAYQRALAEDDPSKIRFRFQVIDLSGAHDAVQMPSGVIIVPRQVMERLQSDDQLAAVLADNIAEALEKDTLRSLPTIRTASAVGIAGDIAGIVIPGASLVGFAGSAAVKHMHELQLQQSGRVSLDLLHDAGYDIRQAPLAWWLLAPKSPKPLDKVGMPARAETLHLELGTTWHAVLETGSTPVTQATSTN